MLKGKRSSSEVFVVTSVYSGNTASRRPRCNTLKSLEGTRGSFGYDLHNPNRLTPEGPKIHIKRMKGFEVSHMLHREIVQISLQPGRLTWVEEKLGDRYFSSLERAQSS
jgi:hypothetical protein